MLAPEHRKYQELEAMSSENISSAAELKRHLSKALAGLSADCGEPVGYLEEVFGFMRESSPFDVQAILGKMGWLLSPKSGGFNILRESGPMTAAELAETMLNPKEPVFKFIGAKTGIDRRTLQVIYDAVKGGGTSVAGGFSIPDFTEERILQEMKWWLVDLNFPKYYFETTPPEEIGNQIRINRFHEMYGIGSSSYANLKISYRSPSGAAIHWVHGSRIIEVEEELEAEYYKSNGFLDVSVYSHGELFLYIAKVSDPNGNFSAATEFEEAQSDSFSKTSDKAAVGRYRTLWRRISEEQTILCDLSVKKETGEKRLMVGFPIRFINHFLSNVSRVMRRAGTPVSRKYCHIFGGRHPVVILSFYSGGEFPADLVESLVDVSIYPENQLARLVEKDVISARELNFVNSAVEFVHQFVRFKDSGLEHLKEHVGDEPGLKEILKSLQRRLDKDNYPYQTIVSTFAERPDIIKTLYGLFESKFSPDPALRRNGPDALKSFEAALKSGPAGTLETEIFRCGLRFVESVLRTNFYLPVKSALAFRLKQDFLDGSDYEDAPFGVFMVKGRDFFGFHVRFKDIARGGIRIIRSATIDDYRLNTDSAFEECYNLAFTQNKKNKDIPEGGSKGVIVLGTGAGPHESVSAFSRYVDALLDMLLEQNSRHIANFEEEILFLGPDEGTAELMDWACRRAHDRGYRYWKGFTTGKSADLGGVSHIDYGMTTNGIHQYVLGILRKLGIDERTITKAQTGGPDGDLGGNEILISQDKTTVVIDGGGVVFDPDGLDRKELVRLARKRLDSSHFDPGKLGPHGFKVKVSDRDITLPGGSKVASGLSFRNGFFLDPRMKADLFLPCGGRPKSVNSVNWKSLLDADGRPIFKWIVEGANLFITQDARLKLEEKGVILFKDSSTNKGGVTSSSLEVLAGLALDDATFEKTMMAEKHRAPEFRKKYIADIISIVRSKADAEFEILWAMRQKTGRPISELSDTLSEKINQITSSIEKSKLFDNLELRKATIIAHSPKTLLKKVGVKGLLKRIPLSYQRAIFARCLASSFVYKCGIDAGYEDYRSFINEFGKQ